MKTTTKTLIILSATIALSSFFTSCSKDKGVFPDLVPTVVDTVYSMVGNQTTNRIITTDDGVFIIGTSTVGNTSKALLIHTNFVGNICWIKELEAGTNGTGIRHLSDGNLLISGSKTDSDQDAFLSKLTPEGNIIWQRTFGGPMTEIAKDVIELEDGSLMLIGTTQSFGAGPISMYTIKTDANGNELWSRTFGGIGADGGSELVQVDGFEVLLLGFTSSFGAGDRDIYLQGVSTDGDSLSAFTFGGAGYEESQAIQRTSDGGFVMSNHSASADPTHKLWATRVDANYQVVWEQEFGALEHEGGEGVLADSEGNFVFLGRTNSFGNDEQVYFIKTDVDGNVLEELNFGDEGDQRGNDIIEDNGSYFICGTSTVNGNSDVLLIKRPM